MAYRDVEEEDDDSDDRDLPQEADMDDEGDDGPEVVPCPYCGKPISEEAEVCPHCKSYISSEDAPARRPWWVVGTAVVCLVVILLTWVLW